MPDTSHLEKVAEAIAIADGIPMRLFEIEGPFRTKYFELAQAAIGAYAEALGLTAEWRVCWNDWRRNSDGEKVDTVIRCDAADETQARQFLADNPERNWIERSFAGSWQPVTG